MAVRDSKTGFTFFNIEGLETSFNAENNVFSIFGGRLLISKEFAAELGRPTDVGMFVGDLSVNTTMRAIEITQIVNGDVQSDVLPPSNDPDAGSVPGPDVIVGDIPANAASRRSSGHTSWPCDRH
ncbi:MAG: hypothetical protein IPK98_08785 [Chloracidobacterium sp.]|nr:hypothetical protein [Chloracidobacterium sp.]